ncbi:MAG: hypothetical protein AB1481_00895 [Candidatus Omnitrophota bacterium]
MRNALITLIAILIILNTAWAGESKTIPVSVTIPAIPGVNVPLTTQEAKYEETQPAQKETKKEEKREARQENSMIVQMASVSSKNVQTIYSR